MKTIFITGIEGLIGSLLRARLASQMALEGVDLPDDLTEAPWLVERLQGVESLIHLARVREPQGVPPDRINPSNIAIDLTVFTAAVQAGIKRVILASSVHADDFRGDTASPPLKAPGSYRPATPYGTYKLVEEEVGAALARRFSFEFVAIRLGGVSSDDRVKDGDGTAATWLSHRDLGDAFAACLAGDPVPGRHTVFYAVSNNSVRVHDTTNPFGWQPADDSAAHQ